MRYYSTRSKNKFVDLREAVLQSLPGDGGLYMPEQIPFVGENVIRQLTSMSFQDIAIAISRPFLGADFSSSEIEEIVYSSINFPAPLVSLSESIKVLELWHGPSLAFKDFGARFMAEVMSRLTQHEDQKLTILVATSGDTGGAVGAGFLGYENIDVVILYPAGRVSELQERQLTTLGQNITALEVAGSFDDCQAMVKAAFVDQDVKKKFRLSSANSINIARLIPQAFYYFEALRQVKTEFDSVSYCVPSGNFGNLTAGLFAAKMGLPVDHFLAATNINDVVPNYLRTSNFIPRRSMSTISNAMDVGNPSNFDRILDLFDGEYDSIKNRILGYSFDDSETRKAIISVLSDYNYVIDPHGAVGYLATKAYHKTHDTPCILLETAHPAKFLPVMEPLVGQVRIPERLELLMKRKKSAVSLSNNYDAFKTWLLSS